MDIDYTSELEDFLTEDGAPVITEIPDKPVISDKTIEDSPMYEDFEFEADELVRIQNMSDEETMQYLAQSLNEINAPPNLPPALYEQNKDPADNLPDATDITDTANAADLPSADGHDKPADEITDLISAARASQPTAAEVIDKYAKLTVEPVWGDIYIKASRSLRELCEEGKLSMQAIETELKSHLLNAAEQFMSVTADRTKIPKVLIPKITELKVAANNFEPYFQVGEDIAVRAMFFMLYQMLSYSDRIAETPETKENLNDFFRRFGAAGIMLSMLDMRV